ncbi:MAG: hypothetical protein MUE68_06840 [Bacteroidetes bacterium]|jgi:hypothetical protein|nr:hypothetical protein [Bacteroidota bacterium]
MLPQKPFPHVSPRLCRGCGGQAFTFLLFLSFITPALSQERQASFDTKGTVLEIKAASPYAAIWKPEVGEFDRLLAFEADTSVTIEVYRTINGTSMRSRWPMDRVRFALFQARLDSAITAVMKRGGEMTEEAIEDLRSTFTYDQTAFSTIHGTTASILTESGAMFWLVTGASYFALSAISDNMNVTPANVEAAKYGHLTGLVQGYLAGLLLFSGSSGWDEFETSVKGTFALTSLGGIGHAIASYRYISSPDVDPTVAYLRMSAERHAIVWGFGATLLAAGEDPSTEAITGTALAFSLSSYLWSSPLFGFQRRQMSWADALLADEFMTPWYLTLISLSTSLEIEDASTLGLVLSAGGVSGFLLGVNLNEGRMRSLGTVKRTRLLMYGGALLGLGVIIGAEPEAKAALWIVTGTTWLGYFIGGRFGGETHPTSSSWDLRLMPENLALGQQMKPTPERPFVRPVPVAVLSVSL